MRYADVILPVPLGTMFTYSIPEGMQGRVAVGLRVIVPFGPRKFYTGIVDGLHDIKPDYEVKEIAGVLDNKPIVRNPQVKLWRWMADYYLSNIGDVMRAALPAGLKVESETNVEVNPDMSAEEAAAVLSERELFTWQTLDHSGKLDLAALAKETGIKGVGALINRMIEKGAVIVSERMVERFKPKKEHYVRLSLPRGDVDALRKAFDSVKRAPRQELVLQTLVELSGHLQKTWPPVEVTRADLLERTGATSEVLRVLIGKGIIESYTREVSRFKYDGPSADSLPQLSAAQNDTLRNIHLSFKNKNVTLLHGVTSSGKTEIYMHLIDFVLNQGKQVLYLVPEIALTTQLTRRLQKVFGNKVVIYHSKFSDAERVEIWHRLLKENGPCVIIGARSSVFLPFSQLGLVIVDEEHEPSYKQNDPSPRYNGRDTATVLASMHGAKTLLGSATPTIETYYKALNGKYGLVELTERFAGAKLPEIEVVDMQLAKRRLNTRGAFAIPTLDAVRRTVADGRQVILFQNRRGYAPVARCSNCGFVPKCDHCDVSLTYHQRVNRMVCHYCTTSYARPEVCPVCKEPSMEIVGYGTERIEENIEEMLHEVRVLRMDLDTTRNKDSYGGIIDKFSNGEADVLVGTQMVTKGLDFSGVETVVVLDADAIISYPDFRSAERAYNMLEQVGGRAGRNGDKGKVIIQTRNPEHPVIQFVKNHDYNSFYNVELEERRKYTYPPFSRVIYIYLRHRDARYLDDVAEKYGVELRRILGNRVFGPQEPLVSRVQNMYIRRIMLKIEPNVSMAQVKDLLREVYLRMHKTSLMKGIILHYDVDPW